MLLGDIPTVAPDEDIETRTKRPSGLFLIPLTGMFSGYAMSIALTPLIFLPLLFLLFLWPIFLNSGTAFAALLFGILFQNGLISFVGTLVDVSATFSLLQGTTFLIIALLGASASIALWRGRPETAIVPWRLFAIWAALTVIYLLYGYFAGASVAAVANFRNFIGGPLLLLIGVTMGRTLAHRDAASFAMVALWIALVVGVVEWLDPPAWYDTIGYLNYFHLKNADFPAATSLEIIDLYTRDLFNTSLFADHDLRTLRLAGPMLHPISYGYAIAVLAIIALTVGHRWPSLLILPFLIQIGSKGPLLLLLVVWGVYVLDALQFRRDAIFSLLAAITGLYIAVALAVGLATGDYHVIGFMGGLNGFLRNPLGHGLGVGGNFSNALVTVNWTEFQKTGADFGLESAIGVLLYQMGAAAVVLPLLYAYAVRRMLQHPSHDRPRLLMSAALIFIFANGIFQEEAFAPAALGLISLFAGLVFAQAQEKGGAT